MKQQLYYCFHSLITLKQKCRGIWLIVWIIGNFDWINWSESLNLILKSWVFFPFKNLFWEVSTFSFKNKEILLLQMKDGLETRRNDRS